MIMKNKKKSVFAFNFSTAALVLIPAAVGINFIGKLFASMLKLPLWLDSIGTILASMLAGPWVGAISGCINNIIYGFQDPISLPYAISSIAIGLFVGIMVHYGWAKSFGKVLLLAILTGLVAAVVSTPINVALWEGTTGNVWGDAVYGVILAKTNSIWLASFIDEILVDLPDKIVVVLISWGLYKALPKNLLQLYKSNTDIEEL
jgi:energy-coupling factor transport system substrate-specific component